MNECKIDNFPTRKMGKYTSFIKRENEKKQMTSKYIMDAFDYELLKKLKITARSDFILTS